MASKNKLIFMIRFWIVRVVSCQILAMTCALNVAGADKDNPKPNNMIYHPNDIPDQLKKEAYEKCQKDRKNTSPLGYVLLSDNTLADCNLNNSAPEPEKAPDASSLTNVLVDKCSGSVKDLVDKCKMAQETASLKCNPEKDQGISSVGSAAKNIALNAGPMASMAGQSGSLRGSCVMIQALSGMANAAVMAFSQNCSKERDDCLDACRAADTAVHECVDLELANPQFKSLAETEDGLILLIRGKVGYAWNESGIQVCSQLASKETEANQASQNVMQALQGGMSCQGKTDGSLKAMAPVTEAAGQLCKMDPTLPGCTPSGTLDCNNPTVAATNPICKCLPGSPNCNGNSGAGDLGGLNSAGSGSPSKIGGAGAPDLSGLMGDGTNPMGFQSANQGANGGEIGGKMGGGANLGGDGGGRGGPPDSGGGGAGGPPGDPVQVNAGYWSGGGGGSSGSGRNGYGDNSNGNGKDKNNGANPDLRKFLPGGQLDMNRRALAGANGSDPIHGPYANIWEKIHIRYQSVEDTLIKTLIKSK